MEQRNPRWGSPRIAQQIGFAFGVEIDKDVVRRILSDITRRNQIQEVLPGLPFLARRRTVCGAAIYSAANRQR